MSRFITHKLLRRALRHDQPKTADLRTARVVSAHGPSHDVVRPNENCSAELVVPKAAPGTFAPNTSTVLGTPEGNPNQPLVLSRPVSGGAAAPVTTSKTATVSQEVALSGQSYLALEYLGRPAASGTSIAVRYLNQGAWTTLYSSLTIPSGHVVKNPDNGGGSMLQCIIHGDDTYDDGSFVLWAFDSLLGDHYLYLVNIADGMMMLLWDGSSYGTGEELLWGSCQWDATNKLVRFVSFESTTVKVRTVTTGATVALEESYTSSGANSPTGAAYMTGRVEVIHFSGGV